MNIRIFYSYLKREKLFLGINFSLIFLLIVILKMLPVSTITIPLADSAYLSSIENDNRISRQFPSLENAGYAVFKRLKLNLPFSIEGPTPVVNINARSTGNLLNYQLIINKQYSGTFLIDKRKFSLFKPIDEKTNSFDNGSLRLVLNFNKPATKIPWCFIKQIAVYANPSETVLKRNWSYIFTVFILPIIIIILISLGLKIKLGKYLLSLPVIAALFILGLSSITSILALQTVLLPILISGLLLGLALYLMKKILRIDIKQIMICIIIFILGLSFWSVMMFHPGHYHPDLKTHIYWGLSAFEQSIGDFSAEYSFFQMNALLLVNAPFPYSPSFYIAVKLLSGEPSDVLFWIRFLPIIMTVLIAPVIFLLVRKITFSEVAAAASATAYLISGITALRILYFFCPALWGTFFIAAAMLLICWRSENYNRQKSLRYFIPEIAAITAGLLAYPAGPFTLGMFAMILLLFWTALDRDRKVLIKNWIKIFIPSFILALALYYVWFIPELIDKVFPKMQQGAIGSPSAELGETVWSRFQGLLGINVIIVLGLIGFILLIQKIKNSRLKALFISWGIAWLILFVARFIPYVKTLFKFSKDELFLLPLLSISIGFLISELWAAKKYGKLLAIAVSMVLIAGFLLKMEILVPRLYIQ